MNEGRPSKHSMLYSNILNRRAQRSPWKAFQTGLDSLPVQAGAVRGSHLEHSSPSVAQEPSEEDLRDFWHFVNVSTSGLSSKSYCQPSCPVTLQPPCAAWLAGLKPSKGHPLPEGLEAMTKPVSCLLRVAGSKSRPWLWPTYGRALMDLPVEMWGNFAK